MQTLDRTWYFSVLGHMMIVILCTTLLAASAFSQMARNGKIAFTSDRDGNLEIYVMNGEKSAPVRLTNNPGVDNHPTWSPDGTRIAFVRQRPEGDFVLSMMKADGTYLTDITPIIYAQGYYYFFDEWTMSWSPDGRQMAFQENDDIIIVNIDGSDRRNITNSPSYDAEPSWSPDGSRILFISDRVPNVRMFTIRPDGTDLEILPSDGEFWDASPHWSPSGDGIVFLVNSENFATVIYTAKADGSNRQLFDPGNRFGFSHRHAATWSPDGGKMLFQIWEYPSYACQIFVKNIDGNGFHQLTNGAAKNFNPSWQPIFIRPSR